MSNIIDYVMI